MGFDKSYESMQIIERKENSLCMEDALKLFLDICSDLKSATGDAVTKLPMGDEDEMVRTVSRVSGILARMVKNSGILNPENQKDARELEVQLEEYEQKTKAMEQQYAAVADRRREVLSRYEAVRKEQEEAQNQIEQAEEAIRTMTESHDELMRKLEETRILQAEQQERTAAEESAKRAQIAEEEKEQLAKAEREKQQDLERAVLEKTKLLEKARTEQEELTRQLQNETDKYENWFKCSEYVKYKMTREALQERLQVLKSAAAKIVAQPSYLKLVPEGAISKDVDLEQYLGHTIEDIEYQLKKYIEVYNTVMDVIERRT